MTSATAVRVPRAELERRWDLIRIAMQEHGIELLLAQANSQFFGGTVRYLSDLPARAGVSTTVLFQRDGGSIVLSHGGVADISVSPEDDAAWRGVSRVLTTPNFPSITYSGFDEQTNLVKALGGYETATIGLWAPQTISASAVDAIRDAFPKIRIIDASEVLDPIRAVKSADEQQLIRGTAALQDKAMLELINSIRPGMAERAVPALAQQITTGFGSDQGVFSCYSAPFGELASPFVPHDKERILGDGDILNILIETNGPGGYFTHMVRTVVLGSAPARLKDEYALALEAQQTSVDLLRPGTAPTEIWQRHNEFLRAHGRPEEKRLFCHAQGYDMTERPVMRPAETLTIQAGMNIGCHPAYAYQNQYVWVCENYMTTDSAAIPLHELSKDIFER